MHNKHIIVLCGLEKYNESSQCSTLVRNTVVKATIKVNGKPRILCSRPIDLIFDTGDYVGNITPQAKK